MTETITLLRIQINGHLVYTTNATALLLGVHPDDLTTNLTLDALPETWRQQGYQRKQEAEAHGATQRHHRPTPLLGHQRPQRHPPHRPHRPNLDRQTTHRNVATNRRDRMSACTDCAHNAPMAPVGSRRESRARHEKARLLRACGLTWQAIADELGYRDRSAARTAVERLQARERVSPLSARRSLVDGLMLNKQLIFGLMTDPATSKDPAAMSALSRELRNTTAELARLDGLHAPQKVDVTVTQDVSERFAELRQALYAQLDEQEAQAIESSQGAAKYVQSERV